MPNVTTRLENTFRFLERTGNMAASSVLDSLFCGASASFRERALKVLCYRRDEWAAGALFHIYNHLTDSEAVKWRSRLDWLHPFLLQSILLQDAASRRGAMRAACDLFHLESIQQLVTIAEESTHAMRPDAEQALLNMGVRIGHSARHQRDCPRDRLAILQLLLNSAMRFSSHRNHRLLEAMLSMFHWQDDALHPLLSQANHPAYRSILALLMSSERQEIVELLAGMLWQAKTPDAIIDLVCQRDDLPMAIQLGRCYSSHASLVLSHHLRNRKPPRSIGALDIRDETIPLQVRCSAWLVYASANAPLNPLFTVCCNLLETNHPWAKQTAIKILRSRHWLDLESLLGILSVEPRNASESSCELLPSATVLRRLLGFCKSADPALRETLASIFRGASFERWLEMQGSYKDCFLGAHAEVLIAIECDLENLAIKELHSPSPKRRSRAAYALRALPMTDRLTSAAIGLLKDPVDDVRVQVLDSLIQTHNPAVLSYLPDLAKDISSEVSNIANRGLTQQSTLPWLSMSASSSTPFMSGVHYE